MWHEARKQEKLTRTRMVDGAKRAERRRKYYESVRKDPEQFMQLHGRKLKIHMDENIARAAEASNILRKWQNDPNLLIDRFDARSHLDIIPSAPATKQKLSQSEELEEIQCDFERYRILILNEFQHYDEAEFLRQISAKEFWNLNQFQSSARNEPKKEKKTPKAAIGFSYGDTETVPGSSKQSDSEESDEDIEDQQEYDLNFDVHILSGERGVDLTHLAEKFGRLQDGFIELLKIDQKQRNEFDQIREIDKAKSSLSGKFAKSDRVKLKRQRAELLSQHNSNDAATKALLCLMQKGRDNKRRRNSSSSSNSDVDTNEKVKFTTAYEDIGPSKSLNLQSNPILKLESPQKSKEYQSLLNLKKHRSESPDFAGQETEKSLPSVESQNESSSKPFQRRNSSSSSSSSTSRSSRKSSTSSSANSREYEPLEIRSSMSESEQERIQIENRKRRIERTKRIHREKIRRHSSSDKSDNDDNAKNAEAAQRLKKHLKKKLKNQLSELKTKEAEKKQENELKQKERDEMLMDEARAIRLREREKRHELEGLSKESPRRQSPSPKRRHSPEPPKRRRSPSPKRRRSRSRSRDRSSRKYSRRSNSRERPSRNHRHRNDSPRRRRSRSHERKHRRR